MSKHSDETARLCNLLENRSIWTNPVNSGTLDNVVAHMRALQAEIDRLETRIAYLRRALADIEVYDINWAKGIDENVTSLTEVAINALLADDRGMTNE